MKKIGKGKVSISKDGKNFTEVKPPAKKVAAPKVLAAEWACVWDTETTGLVTNRSIKLSRQPEVIEFYGVLVDLNSGKTDKDLHKLIQPTVEWPMTDWTIKETKTKLSNDLLADQPKFKEVARDIRNFLEDAPVLIAHNISFDKDMIEIELERLGKTIKWPERCVCTVEQTLYLKGRRLNLTKLHEFLFGEAFLGAHRAQDDVAALSRIACELHQRGMIL